MKNALKLRIIHSISDNAEAEYLLEFFKFIGCLVHDEVVNDVEDDSIMKAHLKQINEYQGVDIVLNYYKDDPYKFEANLLHTERIYIYFSLDERICEVRENPETFKDGQKYSSKRYTRQTALRLLIDEIWKDDNTNREEIQRILECYIPTNGEGDLFYVLQELGCFRVLKIPDFVLAYRKEAEDKLESKTARHSFSQLKELYEQKYAKTILQPVSSFTQTMFSKLIQIRELLTGTNPYIVFARINTTLLIKNLCEYTDCKLNEVGISENGLLYDAQSLINRNPWFITGYSLMADIYAIGGDANGVVWCCRQIQSCITKFPPYYARSLVREGWVLEVLDRRKEAIDRYKMAVKCSSRSYSAIFKLGYYNAIDGCFREAEFLLKKIIYSLDRDIIQPFSNTIYFYEVCLLLAKIYINENKEYSTKATVSKLFQAALAFEGAQIVSKIADSSEDEFRQFMTFHQESMSMITLFKGVQTWSEGITCQTDITNYVKKRLVE